MLAFLSPKKQRQKCLPEDGNVNELSNFVINVNIVHTCMYMGCGVANMGCIKRTYFYTTTIKFSNLTFN